MHLLIMAMGFCLCFTQHHGLLPVILMLRSTKVYGDKGRLLVQLFHTCVRNKQPLAML